ncbi:MAG: substrate-binding domain-containing protein [Terriglobia bacterium]|nr:substrate-binding domain-containing protein [Terriglobia bacterium]
MPKQSPKRLYLIPVLSKALDVLEMVQREAKPMSLENIHQRSQISKTTVYRILKTLVHRGYLAQSQDGLYRPISNPRKIVFGYGCQSTEMPFSEAVTKSLKAAAADTGVDLLVLDNHYDPAIAVRNADEFVRNHVDLVIEFQVDQHAAAIIGDKIAGAGIPLIAVDIPHPHAVYFGVDNFRVGFEAGQLLGRHAKQNWSGKVNWVLGLDLGEAGPLALSRITGAFEGVRSLIQKIPIESFVRMDGRGMREASYRLVLDFLRRHPRDRAILIVAVTDTSALGAVQAARELKRERHIAIVGQDYIEEAAKEIASRRSSLIGSVSHEAQTYGGRLIRLGLAVLGGQNVPPYNYVEHKIVERCQPQPQNSR